MLTNYLGKLNIKELPHISNDKEEITKKTTYR